MIEMNMGQVVIVGTNLIMVVGAVWKVSALLQQIKSELIHVNEKIGGMDRRIVELEKMRGTVIR